MLGYGSMERLVRAPEMETGAAVTDAAAAPASETPAAGAAPAVEPAPLERGTDGEQPTPVLHTRFPESWRHDMAAGDKAFLKTLDRFDSPAALAKAYKELTTKLSAGELRAVRPPAADATPEQVAAWRTAHGLPENAEAYVGGLVLGDGVLAGEANGPMLLSFAQAALAGNWSGEQYSQAVRWYFATQDQLLAERQRADGVFKHATARDLAREWGNDYDVNRNTVVQFCDRHFAQDLKIDLLNARTPDGSLLANHPGFNRAILRGGTNRRPARRTASQRLRRRGLGRREPHRRDRGQDARAPWLGFVEDLLDRRFRVADAAGVSGAACGPRAGARLARFSYH